MPYTDVEFTNGQVVTEGELDTVMGNVDYVRDEIKWRVAGTIPFWGFVSGAANWRLIADASTVLASAPAIPSSWTDLGTGVRNISLSGLTDLATHRLRMETVTGALSVGPFWFYKTPDVNYVSVLGEHRWESVRFFGPYGAAAGGLDHSGQGTVTWLGLRGVSIILHRDSGLF